MILIYNYKCLLYHYNNVSIKNYISKTLILWIIRKVTTLHMCLTKDILIPVIRFRSKRRKVNGKIQYIQSSDKVKKVIIMCYVYTLLDVQNIFKVHWSHSVYPHYIVDCQPASFIIRYDAKSWLHSIKLQEKIGIGYIMKNGFMHYELETYVPRKN